ncbi:MAG: putative baseplate assembly protein [Bradymonadia bacterium]
MIPIPNLDDRTHREIVEEALKLIPQYCPEWTNFNPSDPGITLIELFAWMTEMAIYRLNKVTDKNFIAFLNLMGVRLQAPQPAHALLQFQLVKGGPPTWIRQGFQISTVPDGKDDPVIFEVESDLLVSDNTLEKVFTQVSDLYEDQTPFIDGRRREGFEVFGGHNHIERSLYLGDLRFEQLNEDATLIIKIDSPANHALVDQLEWEYWNGRRWRELSRSLSETEEGAIAFEDIDQIEATDVNGVGVPWIRGRLIDTPQNTDQTLIETVVARIELSGEGLKPEKAYVAHVHDNSTVYITVDDSRTWAPFGKEPKTEHTLYLMPGAFPQEPGSVIRLEVQLADRKTHDAPEPSDDLSLRWEYWNGKKWAPLCLKATPEGAESAVDVDFVDGTEAFTHSGEIKFKRPADLASTDVQGEEGTWIRVRIEAGDYGEAGQYELDGDRWLWRNERPLRPPWVKQMVFRYTERDRFVDHVLTYNDFAYFDHSMTARTPLKVFQAFEPSVEDSPTLYLGFKQAMPNEPGQIYFQMTENTAVQRDRRHAEYLSQYYAERDQVLDAEQRVIWEYWNGLEWVSLSAEDGTRAFTESGFLQFVGPEDWKRSKRFGEALCWLRARLEMGGYHQMPRISHVLLNTVSAKNHLSLKNEVLGASDGTPNQTFKFAQGPVLEGQEIRVREKELPDGPEKDALMKQGEDVVEPAGKSGFWVKWTEVESFYDSTGRSRHYIINRTDGTVQFGDGNKGMIPPSGNANVVARRYRIGGGVRGNVTAQTVTAMRQSLPYIEAVGNPFPAAGGSDQETVEEAKARGPHLIKSRNRAVTAEDFEWLTLQASNGVARAKCLTTIGREGEITIVVVPKQDERDRDLKVKLSPSAELLRRVKNYIDERRLLTTVVKISPPKYVEVSVKIEVIRKVASGDKQLKNAIEQRLRTFLHPLVGSRSGGGWPFGRNVLKLDLYHVIEDIPGVDLVDRIRLFDEDRREEVEQIKVAANQLVHLVDVTVVEKPREEFL